MIEVTIIKKINKIFGEDINFEKIENFELKKELDSYNKLLRESISKNLSKYTNSKLEPLNSISTGYGIMKYHKPERDIRPIITHYDSIVANSQVYIKNLIQPIAKMCEICH